MHQNKELFAILYGTNSYGQPRVPYSPELGGKLYRARAEGLLWSEVCRRELWPARSCLDGILATAGKLAKQYAYDNRLPWPISVPYRPKYNPPRKAIKRDWLILTDQAA